MIGDSPPFLPLFLRRFLRWLWRTVRFLLYRPRWLIGLIVVIGLLELNAHVRQAWLLVLGCLLLIVGAVLRWLLY